MTRLPPPPPVPQEAREVAITTPPPSFWHPAATLEAEAEHKARAESMTELDALRRDLRTIARVHGWPCCERCGAPYGEPGVFCVCEVGPDDRFSWEAF